MRSSLRIGRLILAGGVLLAVAGCATSITPDGGRTRTSYGTYDVKVTPDGQVFVKSSTLKGGPIVTVAQGDKVIEVRHNPSLSEVNGLLNAIGISP